MPEHDAANSLPEPRRKEIFLALVDAQDHEMSVERSRKLIVERFGISESTARHIEREGIDNDWPPLGP
jgi:hypothetical protein